jgi:ERCC4-type nuclease
VVQIDVDRREHEAALVRALSRRADVEIRFRTLRAGDYAVGREIGIERKSSADLAASIVDARLFRQAARLARFYPRPLLLVEGRLPGANVSPEAARGALVSLAAIFRVPSLFAGDPEEAADIVVAAAMQLRRSFEGGYPRHGYRPRGLRARRLYILQGLPRVGPRRAGELLARFGTLEAFFRAGPAEWLEVPGIGPRTARAFADLVKEPTS